MDLRTLLLLTSVYVLTLAQDDAHRLPTNVIPSEYTIDLTLTADFFTSKVFTGTVAIKINVAESTRAITLNSANITYPEGSVTLTSEGNDILVLEDIQYDEEHQQITLTADQELNGEYVLSFANYEALLHEDMYGFYLSYYTDEDGNNQ